jgi:hypothetical protein
MVACENKEIEEGEPDMFFPFLQKITLEPANCLVKISRTGAPNSYQGLGEELCKR